MNFVKKIKESLESYPVRDWTDSERTVSLACSNVTTLDDFFDMLRKKLKVDSACEIKLYLLRAERRWLEARMKIDSTDSLQAALLAVRGFNESPDNDGSSTPDMNSRTEILFHLSPISPDVSTPMPAS